MDRVEAQGIEQAARVVRQHIEVVGTVRRVGAAVAARVEPVDPVIRQDRHLGVPHAMARGQRMAHDHDGRVFGPFDRHS